MFISSNSNTYNLTSTERYITVNDLVLGGIYNISVAAVNSIGSGPFRELQITTGNVGIQWTLVKKHSTNYEPKGVVVNTTNSTISMYNK